MESHGSLCEAGSPWGQLRQPALSLQGWPVMRADLAPSVLSIQGELEAEADAMRASQQELLSVDESVYTPDFDVATPRSNRGLVQKAGYLNLRT